MNLESILIESIAAAINELYGQQVTAEKIQLQKTRKEFEGDFTLVVFPFLALSRKKPEDTAAEIGEYLTKNQPLIASYNVIKGFLNVNIDANYWIELLQKIEATEKWGITPVTENSPLVMVEYSSPNTNKPLHLGHIRNNLLGYALSNIIEANGNRVVKTNIVNDRGIH
ncbi:MAG: arginine--tRNA ligase, partial [Bacteroidaceae bacterium]|nr:arginine--tRNA ligase [Bacteroidaceae bacterium]